MINLCERLLNTGEKKTSSLNLACAVRDDQEEWRIESKVFKSAPLSRRLCTEYRVTQPSIAQLETFQLDSSSIISLMDMYVDGLKKKKSMKLNSTISNGNDFVVVVGFKVTLPPSCMGSMLCIINVSRPWRNLEVRAPAARRLSLAFGPYQFQRGPVGLREATNKKQEERKKKKKTKRLG